MKNLKPSHREKKRYLLVKGKEVNKKNIEETILELIGTLGYAEASPQIIKQNKNSIILAINRTSLDKIRTSFMLSKKDLQIVKVSGSVSNLK
jgi:RNase P/RNase MRP subunit POP5|tara:strand:- start:1607 stop:1882 length:276 start_codon:yes stop_codon:yes gene_type:complete